MAFEDPEDNQELENAEFPRRMGMTTLQPTSQAEGIATRIFRRLVPAAPVSPDQANPDLQGAYGQFWRKPPEAPPEQAPEAAPSLGRRLLAPSYPHNAPKGESATKPQSLGRRLLTVRDKPPSRIPGFSQAPGVDRAKLDLNRAQEQGIFSQFYPGGDQSSNLQSSEQTSAPFAGARATTKGSAVGNPRRARATTQTLNSQPQSGTENQQKRSPSARVEAHATSKSSKENKPQQALAPRKRPQEHPRNRTFFFRSTESAKPQPEPSWTELREHIAQEARAYGIPVKLAEAVVRHESNFNVHSDVLVHDRKRSRDLGIMAINSRDTGWVTGKDGRHFKVDMNRVKNDWKYNVHIGMALLRQAYLRATLNTAGEENVARETYARYNSGHSWRQLYTVPGGKINHNVDQFMKSWHRYYDEK